MTAELGRVARKLGYADFWSLLTLYWYGKDAQGNVVSRSETGGDVVGAIKLRIGRQGGSGDYASATMTWSTTTRPDWDDAQRPRIGQRLDAWLSSAAEAHYQLDTIGADRQIRAVLYVTDCQLSYRRMGTNKMVPVLDWTATGSLAKFGQVMVGDEPWGLQYAWDRVQTIADKAAAAVAPMDAKERELLLIAQDPNDESWIAKRDVDRQPVAKLLRDVADSTGGRVYEQPYGHTCYDRWDGRTGRDPRIELRPDELLNTATWASGLDGIVNDLSVVYRVELGDGTLDERRVRVTDEHSIAVWGRFDATLDTQAGRIEDATRLAELTVGRYSRPRWTIDRLDVDLLGDNLDPAKAGLLLTSNIDDLLHIAGVPDDAPPLQYAFVEGFELSVDRDNARMTIYISDAGLSAPARWVDLGTRTWADLKAETALTWLAAAGWYAPPPEGSRWVDVASNVNWYDLGDPYWSTVTSGPYPTWATYQP